MQPSRWPSLVLVLIRMSLRILESILRIRTTLIVSRKCCKDLTTTGEMLDKFTVDLSVRGCKTPKCTIGRQRLDVSYQCTWLIKVSLTIRISSDLHRTMKWCHVCCAVHFCFALYQWFLTWGRALLFFLKNVGGNFIHRCGWRHERQVQFQKGAW